MNEAQCSSEADTGCTECSQEKSERVRNKNALVDVVATVVATPASRSEKVAAELANTSERNCTHPTKRTSGTCA
jgi:hypothetical protein